MADGPPVRPCEPPTARRRSTRLGVVALTVALSAGACGAPARGGTGAAGDVQPQPEVQAPPATTPGGAPPDTGPRRPELAAPDCLQRPEPLLAGATDPGPLLTASEEAAYVETWRWLVAARSGLDPEQLDERIEVLSGRASVLRHALVFQVWFRLRVGWAVLDGTDQFLLERDPDWEGPVEVDFRDTRLLAPDVVGAEIDRLLYDGQLTVVDPGLQLRFDDCQSAVTWVEQQAGVTFEPLAVTRSAPYGVEPLGHVYLSGLGQQGGDGGGCQPVDLDLVSGEVHLRTASATDCGSEVDEARARLGDPCRSLLLYPCPVLGQG